MCFYMDSKFLASLLTQTPNLESLELKLNGAKFKDFMKPSPSPFPGLEEEVSLSFLKHLKIIGAEEFSQNFSSFFTKMKEL